MQQTHSAMGMHIYLPLVEKATWQMSEVLLRETRRTESAGVGELGMTHQPAIILQRFHCPTDLVLLTLHSGNKHL
jgi:hypothetical protein